MSEELVKKAVIHYKDSYGIEREAVLEGDFVLGRKDEGSSSYLVAVEQSGKETVLLPCDRSISRKHAQCFWSGSSLMLQDIGSMNGTYVNGCILEGWVKKSQSRPLQIPRKVQVTLMKGLDIQLEPQTMPSEVERALKEAGVKPGAPVIINIDKSRHIGSMDIVANRSDVVIDTEEFDELGEKKKKRKDEQDCEDV